MKNTMEKATVASNSCQDPMVFYHNHLYKLVDVDLYNGQIIMSDDDHEYAQPIGLCQIWFANAIYDVEEYDILFNDSEWHKQLEVADMVAPIGNLIEISDADANAMACLGYNPIIKGNTHYASEIDYQHFSDELRMMAEGDISWYGRMKSYLI